MSDLDGTWSDDSQGIRCYSVSRICASKKGSSSRFIGLTGYQDYIRTANAKGLRRFVVIYRHAMKNALLPVITVVGISIAAIIGGSVIMETIFQLPGIGVYVVKGMNQRDFPVVQSMVSIIAVWIILSNLIVDVTYAWLDPRIRL